MFRLPRLRTTFALPALAAVAALLLGLGGAPLEAAGRGKDAPIDRALARRIAGAPSATVPVLIERANGHAALGSIRARGGTVRRELKGAHALAVQVPASAIPALARE